MSITELGALGEFIGSVLVLGTLIYLVVQVRQARDSINSANAVNLTQMFNPVNLTVVQDDEMFNLFYRGCNDPKSLTELEASRFHLILRAYNNNFWSVRQCALQGTVPEETWDMLSRNYAELLATPGGRTLIPSLAFADPDWSRLLESLAESTDGEMRWTAEGYQRADRKTSN